MEILKLKVVEREGKKEIIKIPITVEDKSVPAQQFKVEIQKDTPLKSQKQSKFVVKNMNEYEARLFEAKQELYKFKKRYSAFPELKKIFDAIDEI